MELHFAFILRVLKREKCKRDDEMRLAFRDHDSFKQSTERVISSRRTTFGLLPTLLAATERQLRLFNDLHKKGNDFYKEEIVSLFFDEDEEDTKIFQAVEMELQALLEMLADAMTRLVRMMEALLSILGAFSILESSSDVRPLCTTMPWNLRPPLVVLWGVCWMFIMSPAWMLAETFTMQPPINPESMTVQGPGLWDQQIDLWQLSAENWDGLPQQSPQLAERSLESRFGAHGLALAFPDQADASPPSHPYGMPNGEPPSVMSTVAPDAGSAGGTQSSGGGRLPRVDGQLGTAPRPEALDARASADAGTQRDPELLKCQTCQKTFSRLDALKRHQKEHYESNSKKFLCPHPRCTRSRPGRGFKRRTHLNRHLSSTTHVGLSLAPATGVVEVVLDAQGEASTRPGAHVVIQVPVSSEGADGGIAGGDDNIKARENSLILEALRDRLRRKEEEIERAKADLEELRSLIQRLEG